MRRRYTAIDLFCGCGGLSLGLRQAGFDVLAAVECDEAAVATYRMNHPAVNVVAADIRTIDTSDVRVALGVGRGELDLLAGCPPCQGYSALRTRNGGRRNRDGRNGLVREMLRFAQAFLPRAIMMENVPGLDGKAALRDLRVGLRELGYEVTVGVKNARFYCVPQRRRRLILLAGHGFQIEFAEESRKEITVRQAIAHLPRAGISGDLLHDLPERRTEEVRKRIAKIPKNGGSRVALGRAQLSCHKGFDGFKDVFGRMAWDVVAPTITGGCFNPSKGRFLHPDEDRCITLREAALLQSFPKDYRFDLSAGKQATALMIGNALPPEFIRRHAIEIKRAIKKRLG